MAGLTITMIGGLLAGISRLWDPVRLVYLIIVLGSTALCMISFMFLMMVRVDNPLVPRAIFGVLNTLLFFPSGAIYPTEGFPLWLRAISRRRSFHLRRTRAQKSVAQEHRDSMGFTVMSEFC